MSFAAQIEVLTRIKEGTHPFEHNRSASEHGRGLCHILRMAAKADCTLDSLDSVDWHIISSIMGQWPGRATPVSDTDFTAATPVPRMGGLAYSDVLSTQQYKFDPSHAQGRARLQLNEWLLDKLVTFSKTDLQKQIDVCVRLIEGTYPLHHLESGLCVLLQRKYNMADGELTSKSLFNNKSPGSNAFKPRMLYRLFAKWPGFSGSVTTPVIDPDKPADDHEQRDNNAHGAYFTTNSVQKFDPETAYGRERLKLTRFILSHMIKARDKELMTK